MAGDFRFGVVGAFSGSGAGTRPDPVHEVDRDDFDALFTRLAPRLPLGLPFCGELELDAWEQLHPDRLVERVPELASLLAARAAAANPARVREALPTSGGGSLLDAILGGGARGPTRTPRAVADPELARILDEIASPHAEHVDHAGMQARVSVVDASLGARVRALLHHPAFRRLESSWRSLRQLVRASETGDALRIHVIDLALESEDAPARLQQLVEEAARADDGFDLLLLDCEVEATDDGLALLGALGRAAGAGRVPSVLGAVPSLWEPESADSTRAFLSRARALPGAERLALCGPRLLVRLPYGKASEPLERFAFEEVVQDGDSPAALCWGNGAFALARAVLDSVAVAGTPSAGPRFALREGLPVHAVGPGSPAGPTERALSESEVGKLRELGLLALAAIRGRDALLVTSFRSLTGAPLFPA